ncbi:MAG: exodeoxyribonuclease VII large subunit [Sulfuriferula sp.]
MIALPLSPLVPPLSVSALNRLAREMLEQTLPLTWVAGEISNLTRAVSGHWYFSLKDASAQVRCVMFRGRNQFIDWQPENGMQVEVRATPTLYEARGEFQLQVDTLRRAGMGALFEAFEQLKTRLAQEGLFDSARKRVLPRFPQRIGIVTSLQAAALHDVLTTLKRRMPGLPVVLYPATVQGVEAKIQIVTALQNAYRRAECDVLILCRGGGSIEDMWPFNEEIVARTIIASPIPIVCGIGHETDFTIADFAADLRAPTPTAAAELASPDRIELSRKLQSMHVQLLRMAQRRLNTHHQQLDYLSRRLIDPARRLEAHQTALGNLGQRLHHATLAVLERLNWQHRNLVRQLHQAAPDFASRQISLTAHATGLVRAMHLHLAQTRQHAGRLASHLAHLNPEAVLSRGYAIVQNAQGGIVSGNDQIHIGELLSVRLARGSTNVKVIDKSGS